MLGACYYRLGMFRDAVKQFKSSLAAQPMVFTTHLLAKVYIRLDQVGRDGVSLSETVMLSEKL